MATLTIDSDAMAAVASAAIFDSLSEDVRTDILTQAVQYLITPVKSQHYATPSKSPLQEAFERSLQNAAYQAVEEKIKNDETVAAQINELLGPLILGAMAAEGASYNDGLANAIGQALGSYLAEQSRKSRDY